MNKRAKLAIIALLGFSTACSTLKSTSKSNDKELTSALRSDIMVMYGVPQPEVRPVELQEIDLPNVQSNDVTGVIADEKVNNEKKVEEK